MKDFIKEVLLENGFKESYIESLISNTNFLTPEDYDFYNSNKSKSDWKTRIFGKLNFKSYNKQTKNYWIYRGYSELEARDLIKTNKLTRKNPTPMQKEFWIKKGMTDEEAIFKIKSSRKTQPEYWMANGYSMQQAIEKIRDYQKTNSEKLKEKKDKNPELFEDVTWNQKKYWMKKGFTEEKAEKKISELQSTFSLKKCIEKYGEEQGTKKWLDRQDKWNRSYKKTNYSKISQDLFWRIMEKYDPQEKNIFFATYKNGKLSDDDINREYTITGKTISVKPDFLLLEDMKIIEFDGIYWHNHKKRNKPENEKREILRQNELINLGYSVLRIREDEYANNPTDVTTRCLDFLKH